ncbi:MAG: FHA domain-containing protein [Gammaproteobacteria bacterium]|jgi:pSer/pThr/pTyr-binding forkhead associated (FHA) protein
MDSRTYVIGRVGQIKVDDASVSSRHAELAILGENIYITDLGSTNGTFLMVEGKPKRFTEGYVKPDDIVVFGTKAFKVKTLLDKVGHLAP